jgi:hypothetical protein
LNQLLQVLPAFIQLAPMMAQLFGPQAVRAMLDQVVRVYRIPNRQAFLGGSGAAADDRPAGPAAPPAVGEWRATTTPAVAGGAAITHADPAGCARDVGRLDPRDGTGGRPE